MVLPLIKRIVSLFGSHCRSFFAPPSVVNCLRFVPSTFTSQISLLATKAILSAPPRLDTDGLAVSVGAGGVSVLAVSSTAIGKLVGASVGTDVSVFKTIVVDVLIGTSVLAGLRPPLNTKNPAAITATTPSASTGRITRSALNPFFWGAIFTLVLTVGNALFVCSLVGS